MAEYLHLEQAKSTNSYLLERAASLPGGTVVYTYCQTAGRGQKGNSWESEPGKNLSFSVLLKRPALAANRQFHISEACSLAVYDFLSQYTGGISIKWPNDVYWHDSKICGMLIENSLTGREIAYSIPGIGININQERFHSDAPNPVSLTNITGQHYELDTLLHDVCERVEAMCDFASMDESAIAALHQRYLRHLYRNDGQPHPWALPDGTQLAATIHDIAPDGMLTLRHADGSLHSYAFKQVKHVIDHVAL